MEEIDSKAIGGTIGRRKPIGSDTMQYNLLSLCPADETFEEVIEHSLLHDPLPHRESVSTNEP